MRWEDKRRIFQLRLALLPDDADPPQAHLQKVTAAMRGAGVPAEPTGYEGFWAGSCGCQRNRRLYPTDVLFFGWVDPTRQRKVIEFLRRSQKPMAPGRPITAVGFDLDVTIQCYFSLKLGRSADEPSMLKAKSSSALWVG
jgi:hypothetical protein